MAAIVVADLVKRCGAALVVAFAGLVLMLGLGVVAYDLELEAGKLPALVLALAVGGLAFSALGVAVAGLIRSQEAAPAVTNAIVLPMAFVSNTFIPVDDSALPGWLDAVSRALPMRPFVERVQAAFNPTVAAPAVDWGNLGVVALWGLVAVVVAARTFTWEPIAGDARRARRRRRGGADRALEGT